MAEEARAVIFDLDGVLVDSYKAHWESWRRLADEQGYELREEQFALSFGRTSREIIAAHFDSLLSDQRIEEIDERKEALYREIIEKEFPAMEGAVELIEALVEEGFSVAIGSSGPPENIDLCLERLGCEGRIAVVVNGMDVEKGKPDPEVFQIVAERLDLKPHRCIVVEDAAPGIHAAKAAGMASVGLASTGRRATDLSIADVVATSLRQLSPHLFEELLYRRTPVE